MILTDAERAEVLQVLASRGIEGADAETSLRTICVRAGDCTLDELVAELRDVYGTDQHVGELLGIGFGHDALPAVLILRRWMP